MIEQPFPATSIEERRPYIVNEVSYTWPKLADFGFSFCVHDPIVIADNIPEGPQGLASMAKIDLPAFQHAVKGLK